MSAIVLIQGRNILSHGVFIPRFLGGKMPGLVYFFIQALSQITLIQNNQYIMFAYLGAACPEPANKQLLLVFLADGVAQCSSKSFMLLLGSYVNLHFIGFSIVSSC